MQLSLFRVSGSYQFSMFSMFDNCQLDLISFINNLGGSYVS